MDLKAVEPYLGYYEGGWSMVREGRELLLRIGPRTIPLLVMPDGTFVMAGGPNVGAGSGWLGERRDTPRRAAGRRDRPPDNGLTGRGITNRSMNSIN